MWVPRALGGAEVEHQTLLDVVEEISRQDGSVGWTVMIAANDGVLWGYLQHDVASELMAGDASCVIAGTILGGAGTAERVPGGYRLSGLWPFASGCRHADWMVASAAIKADDQGDGAGDAAPQVCAFILGVDEVEILDTWHTAGLRGTGSEHFRADKVFVPEERHWPSLSAHGYQPGPIYNTPLPVLWGPNIAAVALGIGRDAVDTFTELAGSKRSSRNPTVLANRETMQERVGEAEALLQSGRAFLYEMVRSNWATLSTGGELPERQAALGRLAAATAVRNAVQAVDIVFAAAGSASVYETNRLERCFRDVHMVPQHAVVGQNVFANAGRSFLGLGLGR